MKEDGDKPVRPSREQIEPELIFVCVNVLVRILRICCPHINTASTRIGTLLPSL